MLDSGDGTPRLSGDSDSRGRGVACGRLGISAIAIAHLARADSLNGGGLDARH